MYVQTTSNDFVYRATLKNPELKASMSIDDEGLGTINVRNRRNLVKALNSFTEGYVLLQDLGKMGDWHSFKVRLLGRLIDENITSVKDRDSDPDPSMTQWFYCRELMNVKNKYYEFHKDNRFKTRYYDSEGKLTASQLLAHTYEVYL